MPRTESSLKAIAYHLQKDRKVVQIDTMTYQLDIRIGQTERPLHYFERKYIADREIGITKILVANLTSRCRRFALKKYYIRMYF